MESVIFINIFCENIKGTFDTFIFQTYQKITLNFIVKKLQLSYLKVLNFFQKNSARSLLALQHVRSSFFSDKIEVSGIVFSVYA